MENRMEATTPYLGVGFLSGTKTPESKRSVLKNEVELGCRVLALRV